MNNPIFDHQKAIADNIQKSFDTDYGQPLLKGIDGEIIVYDQVFSIEDVNRFQNDLNKAFQANQITADELEKAKKDLSRLAMRQVFDKNGHKRVVYVKVHEDEHGKTHETDYDKGHKVKFHKDGKEFSGTVKSMKYNDKTDKVGTAMVESDGKTYSVSLSKLKHHEDHKSEEDGVKELDSKKTIKDEEKEHSDTYNKLKKDAKDGKLDTTEKEFAVDIHNDHKNDNTLPITKEKYSSTDFTTKNVNGGLSVSREENGVKYIAFIKNKSEDHVILNNIFNSKSIPKSKLKKLFSNFKSENKNDGDSIDKKPREKSTSGWKVGDSAKFDGKDVKITKIADNGDVYVKGSGVSEKVINDTKLKPHGNWGGDQSKKENDVTSNLTSVDKVQEFLGEHGIDDGAKKIDKGAPKVFWSGYEKYMKEAKKKHNQIYSLSERRNDYRLDFDENDHHEDAIEAGAKAIYDKYISKDMKKSISDEDIEKAFNKLGTF